MTLSNAATKSRANFAGASSCAYTSETARSSECLPKMRSQREAVSVVPPGPCASNASSPVLRHSIVSISVLRNAGDRPCASPPANRPLPSELTPIERRPATSTTISGTVRPRSCALSTISSSAATPSPGFRKLRKPSATGSSTAKDSTSVSSCEASPRPARKGTSTARTSASALAASAPSTATTPASTMVSATLAPCFLARGVRTSRTLASCSGLFASHPRCGSRRMRAPFAPPRKSEQRKVAALAQAVSAISAALRPLERRSLFRPSML
mmetsp:Transcript_9674/g.39812  ORF Transcript_9674/g.39812 Transcript_9674/m.39812 type:complete len:270 (+) Transcript_9674:51-860(+)